MANSNVDKPRGFTPVRTLSGAPVSGKMEVFPIGASEVALGVGDAVELVSGAIGRAETNDSVLGVVMAFGSTTAFEFGDSDGFNPDRLNTPSLSLASTAGQTALVCLANDVVFSCQTDDSSTTDPVIGAFADLISTVVGSGNNSQMEVDTNVVTNTDTQIVDIPFFNSAGPDAGSDNGNVNDAAEVNAEVHIIFTDVVFGQA